MDTHITCPFCNSNRVIEENETAYTLASNPRLTFGHLLVIPKRHIEKPWDMRSYEAKDVWKLIKNTRSC